MKKTLLQEVADFTIRENLAKNYSDFAVQFLGKNSNWYAYQTHMGRDFSLPTLINCLQKFQKLTAKLGAFNTVWETEILEIEQLQTKMQNKLQKHLGQNVRIKIIS